jgi:hypothetical protein
MAGIREAGVRATRSRVAEERAGGGGKRGYARGEQLGIHCIFNLEA